MIGSILSSCALVVMTVTAYVPGLGGTNGGMFGGYDKINGAWVGGKKLTNSDAACGFNYRFGTIFFIIPNEDDDLLKSVGGIKECNDRGGMIGPKNLDIAIVGPNAEKSLALAMKWGKQKRHVVVCGKGIK